jgi:L-malate glycosyltransferase
MAKIGIISTLSVTPWGGSEYLWAATAEQALLEGHQVVISVNASSMACSEVIKLKNLGAELFPRYIPKDTVARKIARKIAKKLTTRIPALQAIHKSPYQPVFEASPDIICINQGNSYQVFGIPELVQLLQEYAVPYIPICHFNSELIGKLDSSQQLIAQDFFAEAACIAFVSQHNLEVAEHHLAQSLPNATVVKNPVNLDETGILPWLPHSEVGFANVARLDTTCKGQDILFQVLSLPIWRQRNWKCNLYGLGADRAYLESLAKYYGISDRVHFNGHVNDVRSIWEKNHILVLPSRGEGTPLALVESMLCGRPAIVTDVGGNAEWITEPKTGFIAEAPTKKLLSAALERAWQSQEDWKQMGINAYDYAIANLDASPGKSLLTLILEAMRKSNEV